LGSIVNETNKIEEIHSRIAAVNRAYHANKKLQTNKLLSKNSKMSVHKTIIRRVVTYGSETWMMNITHEEKLKIFERKILRSVYGPVQDSNNEWRVRTNQEIEALMKEENIVRFIKSRRLARYGHINRMEDNKNVIAIMKWNPIHRR
jgi:hypothetical protein